MSQAKLKAVTEEFDGTAETIEDILRHLPEETRGVEKFLQEQTIDAVHEDTDYPAFVSSLSFGALPAPKLIINPARDGLGSVNPPTITAPVVTQVSAPVMTPVVVSDPPNAIAENPPTSLHSINMPVLPSYPQISDAPTLNPHASSFVPTSSQAPTESSTAHELADLAEQLYISRIPVPEPPVFSGSPLEYAAWKSAFEILRENKRIPPAENIHYLKQYLTGKARECVEGLFLFSTEEAYQEAEDLLDSHF